MRARPPLVLLVITLVATSGCGDAPAAGGYDDTFKPPANQPAALADLQGQAGELVQGGLPEYTKQVEALEGNPIVVNKWASWCGPCAAEFPHFAGAAQAYAGEVAFLGVDTLDDIEAAGTFLDSHPVPYPSFVDQDAKIAQDLKAVAAFPATVFYDANGDVAYIKQGGYATQEALEQDIDRYALAKKTG